jgi:alpha-N-arabinofuranosidase
MYRFITALGSFSALLGVAQAVTLNVGTSGGNASSPLLYGLLFEVYMYSSTVFMRHN